MWRESVKKLLILTFILYIKHLQIIALGCGLDGPGSRVRFQVGAGNFFLHHRIQNGSGAHPASYPWVTGALSLGVRRPGREVDHSTASSAEVKE
jgi:hypothetical protein